MLALALEPLLDNARLLGLGRALRVLEAVARMARETVEGQALELDWARRGHRALGDRDYLNMVHKKTGWYTFITPVLVGATVAGADARALTRLKRFATLLGVAFQIHDDVLNLVGDEQACGKERDGDLWEGKLTLILLHLLRAASAEERARIERALARPRADKQLDEIADVRALVDRHGSIDYARRTAVDYARRAEALLDGAGLGRSAHHDFIAALPRYVIGRDR
jgi:geranylgeranyl diphosphate synthase type II